MSHPEVGLDGGSRVAQGDVLDGRLALDGYIVGPDGRFDWTAPDDQLFRFAIEQIRDVSVHLM